MYIVNMAVADILMCLGLSLSLLKPLKFFAKMILLNVKEQKIIQGTYTKSYSVSVPLTPLSTFMDKWIFGEILCKVTGASQVSK